MYFMTDKNTFRVGKNRFVNVDGNVTRIFDSFGYRIDSMPTSVLKKKLEDRGILPFKEHPLFENSNKELLLAIANS